MCLNVLEPKTSKAPVPNSLLVSVSLWCRMFQVCVFMGAYFRHLRQKVFTRPRRWYIFWNDGMSMVFHMSTIGINGFSNGFWSINHWSRWSFSLATIGLDGFAMVFGLATIGLNGFSMVANHWSNDGMVTIHCYGLDNKLCESP